VPWYLRRGEGRWIAGTDFLKPEHIIPTRARIAFGKAVGGRPVLPWTVDDTGIANRMLAIGCEGVISNIPHKLGIKKETGNRA
jgi:glycerophosphoryl diester phosphodiesterase